MRRALRAAALGGMLLLAGLPVARGADGFSGDRDVQRFIDQMVSRHRFERKQLSRLFHDAHERPDVITAISRPAEAKPWYQYRDIFLTGTRIAGGVQFWRSHADVLDRAAREYGVDPAVIVAILGVETHYGSRTGSIPVLDSLSTLAFRYPRRADFFRSELEQFLLLTREERLNPLAVEGSYAGAMGLPQFIASSYRRYAVDFDGDNVRNLMDDVDDAVGSVANYLKEHGWRRGDPVAIAARVDGDGFHALLERGLKPNTPVSRMKDYGLKLQGPVPDSDEGALVELEDLDGKEYWVGLQNFYTITRYNHSALYAMAVYQLAEAIRSGYEQPRTVR